jgi:AcrR family transcriptional regulator
VARRPLTKPRKNASQDRSRATVDALVEATARILVKEGFDKASTNRIAETAGVSVGSLYQYFPSKEALVVAVIDRHNQATMRLVRSALSEVAGQPVESVIRKMVEVAIRAHRIEPKLHRVLTEQIPRTGQLENVEAFNREYFSLFRNYLTGCGETLREVDPGLAAYVCVTSIEALAHNAVLRSEKLTDVEAEALTNEVSRMIVGYLLQ